MENELHLLRKEIDKIDEQMMELFVKRMQIAEKIAIYKQKNNIKIKNNAREKEIKDKITNHSIFLVREYYENVNKALLKSSKKYQKALIKSMFR